MRSSALTRVIRYNTCIRSGQAVKRKKGHGQKVKSGFRAESSGQDIFQAVNNLDPGREWSYSKFRRDHPLLFIKFIMRCENWAQPAELYILVAQW